MTIQERTEVAEGIFKECLEMAIKKGADYSGKEDALANFKRNGERLGMTKYQIWSVYFAKHIDSIMNSIKANAEVPQVESEPLRGRVVDAIVYLTIFEAMLIEDNNL